MVTLFEKLGCPRLDAEPSRTRLLLPSAAIVLRANGALLVPVAILDHRGHAVLVLVEGDELRPVLEACATLSCVTAEDRLEPDLGDEQPRRRAQRLVALVDVAEVVLELLAGERLDRDDGAVLLELEEADASTISGSMPTLR